MSPRITQCPRCQTSFRVTAVQLQVAAGAVRCGSCLHIFNAAQHWTDELPPSSQQNTPSLDHIDDDTPLFDDDNSLFDDSEEDDEPDPMLEPQYSDSFLDLDEWEEEPRTIFKDLADADHDPNSAGDEQWAHQLLQELEEEESGAPPRKTGQKRVSDDVLASVPTIDEPAEPEAEDEALRELEAAPQPQPEPALRAVRDEAHTPLESLRAEPRRQRVELDLEPEPLELTREQDGPRGRGWLYALGSLLAILGLAGQYLFFNFNSLAHGPHRPWLEHSCKLLGCQLPAQSAPELIRSGSLMVRSHPEVKGALVVDAILTNQAPFAQPYPRVQLVFADMDGAAVAVRTFTPTEYLAGELSGSSLMPSRQPVHIALELHDPGPQATNYELHLGPAPAHSP